MTQYTAPNAFYTTIRYMHCLDCNVLVWTGKCPKCKKDVGKVYDMKGSTVVTFSIPNEFFYTESKKRFMIREYIHLDECTAEDLVEMGKVKK